MWSIWPLTMNLSLNRSMDKREAEDEELYDLNSFNYRSGSVTNGLNTLHPFSTVNATQVPFYFRFHPNVISKLTPTDYFQFGSVGFQRVDEF